MRDYIIGHTFRYICRVLSNLMFLTFRSYLHVDQLLFHAWNAVKLLCKGFYWHLLLKNLIDDCAYLLNHLPACMDIGAPVLLDFEARINSLD